MYLFWIYNIFLQGIFSPKTRAKTMLEGERKRVDGCAIFWRASKFTLLKEHLIEFSQVNEI